MRCYAAIRRWARREEGATLAEYALLIAAVSLVALGGAKCMGSAIGLRLGATAATVANP